MKHPKTRRQFIKLAGAGSLGLPFLPSLLRRGSEAQAAGGAAPRRLIVLWSPNGQRSSSYWPQQEHSSLWVDRSETVRELPLGSLPGEAISPVFGPKFHPFKDKLLLCRGVDNLVTSGASHEYTYTLTGRIRGDQDPLISIDRIAANSESFYDFEPARRSVHVLIKPSSGGNTRPISHDAGGVPIEATTHPAVVFDQLFGGFSPEPSDQPDLVTPRRLDVLDTAIPRYRSLEQDPRLGREDRQRLEAHIDMVAALRERVASGMNGPEGCTVPGAPQGGDEPGGEEHLPAWTDAAIDTLAAAIKCDRTRVVTLQLAGSAEKRTYSYLPEGPFPEGHHEVSHETEEWETLAKLEAINAWYGDKVARFLQALDDTIEDPSTGTTYLDNSLVYWGNECGVSVRTPDQGGAVHWVRSYPVMLAGSAGGWLDTGRLIDYRHPGHRSVLGDKNDEGSVPYNQLLVTIMQALGLTPQEYERHGGQGLGDYLGSTIDRRAPLPFVRA